jgi:hypothetical protein
MAPAPSPAPPGTPFSPLAGWEGILIVLVLLVAVGLAFLALLAVRTTAHERSDWQAWLDAWSTRPGATCCGGPQSGHVDCDLQLPRPGSDRGAEGCLHVGDGVDVADVAVAQAGVCRQVGAGVGQHAAPIQGDA